MSTPVIDPADKKLFNNVESIRGELKDKLVELLMAEVELESARGNPKRYRGYRSSVLTWMIDNVNDTGKRDRDDYYKVNFEFERKSQKKSRVMYPETPVKIPNEVLQAAFLSGSSGRIQQSHVREVPGSHPVEKILHDSNRMQLE